jgi:hypothetical protein
LPRIPTCREVRNIGLPAVKESLRAPCWRISTMILVRGAQDRPGAWAPRLLGDTDYKSPQSREFRHKPAGFRGIRVGISAMQTVWRRGRDSITAVTCKSRLNQHLGDITHCLCGLQADSISGWSFYSFSYSLQFRRKRYHWYQSLPTLSLIRTLESPPDRLALRGTPECHMPERPPSPEPLPPEQTLPHPALVLAKVPRATHATLLAQ